MLNNLPALDVLLDALEGPLRARWKRYVAETWIKGYEQTSQLVRAALHRKDVDGALCAVYRAREERRVPPAQEVSPQAAIVQNTKRDEATASAISELSARRAAADQNVNVRVMRESILGRAEPLSRAEAWEFLNKAERLPQPIPWERLHAGWDRIPLMSQTQFGAHGSLSFRDKAGRDHEFRAGMDSVLATLWMWSGNLSRAYNWPRSQAAWFLLTGETPSLMPVSVLIEGGLAGALTSIVTVTTLAYGGEESVTAALTMAKRQLLGRRRGPLALARHVMAEFVDEQFERESARPEWPELWRRWNKFAPPQWRLRQRKLRYPDWKAMLDAYRREKDARGETEARVARTQKNEVRLRSGAGDEAGIQPRKRQISSSRGLRPTDRS